MAIRKLPSGRYRISFFDATMTVYAHFIRKIQINSAARLAESILKAQKGSGERVEEVRQRVGEVSIQSCGIAAQSVRRFAAAVDTFGPLRVWKARGWRGN
jgi:hypothetical protein